MRRKGVLNVLCVVGHDGAQRGEARHRSHRTDRTFKNRRAAPRRASDVIKPAGRRAIALFAKAAEPGRVKTRLVPPLSDQQAAQLAQAFLLDSVAAIKRVAHTVGAEPFIFFTPHQAKPWFQALFGQAARLQPQRGEGLTERLQQAYLTLQSRAYSTVCFIGADSPTIPERYLVAAFDALQADNHVAIGPASDGGYYLIGLGAPHLELFEGIAWSTDRVLAQTCETVERLGLRLTMLPQWYDVDEGASLQRLQDELAPETSAHGASAVLAPYTRACLSLISGG